MSQKANPRLTAAVMEVVENQIRDGTPPETKQTLDRLMAEGYAEQEARRLIANVVASEIFDILKNKELYDRDRYVTALHRLPKLPWE
jgi:hypothetical protein